MEHHFNLHFNPHFLTASDFKYDGMMFSNIRIERSGDVWVIKYTTSGSKGSSEEKERDSKPISLSDYTVIARLIIANMRGELDSISEGVRGAIEILSGAVNEDVSNPEYSLKFTSVVVEDLANIFYVYDDKLSLHAMSQLVSMDKNSFKDLRGRSKKWVKGGSICVVYFPKEGKDNNISPTTPTFNRFASWYGKKWGIKLNEIDSKVVSAIGLSFGWHGLLTDEGGKAIKSVYPEYESNLNRWIIYTSTIVKCKPIKEWHMKEVEVALYFAYSCFNEIRAGPKGDFIKKSWSSLIGLGLTLDQSKLFDLLGAIVPVIVKYSGSGTMVPENILSKILWMKENSTILATTTKKIDIGDINSASKIKDEIIRLRNNRST